MIASLVAGNRAMRTAQSSRKEKGEKNHNVHVVRYVLPKRTTTQLSPVFIFIDADVCNLFWNHRGTDSCFGRVPGKKGKLEMAEKIKKQERRNKII
jgi:hypothetical protein